MAKKKENFLVTVDKKEKVTVPKEKQRDTIQVYGIMARSIHEGLQQFFPQLKNFKHGLEIRNIGKDKIPFMTFIEDMYRHYTNQLDNIDPETISPEEGFYYRGMGRILVDIDKALKEYA